LGRIAVAVMSGRTPEVAEVVVELTPRPPPAVMSVVDTSVYVNPMGSPLRNELTPESCQLSRTVRLTRLLHRVLSFGVR
jgi:hypothetical protein